MSIPLDRLYNFLNDVVNCNIIIYRWLPYGSKKLVDLKPLKGYSDNDWLTMPVMFCHDQEPLDYQYYNFDSFKEFSHTRDPLKLKMLTHHSASNIFQPNLRFIVFENLYDLVLLTHSEVNSHQVKTYEDNGFVPVYFWSHALIARDWYRYAETDPGLATSKVTYDFLIYNRAWSGTREYRLKFAELVVTNRLDQNCLMGFNPFDSDINYIDYKFKNNAFTISSSDLEDYFFLNSHDSSSSADYDSNDYAQCRIEVVLETLFDDQRKHLTEKSLRPIACGKPFILASSPGSLEYLRLYGFETFSGLIDESYDLIDDPIQRLHAIIAEMKRISILSSREKSSLTSQLNQIAKRNKDRFFSSNFQERIINEYRENFFNAYKKVLQSREGKHWTKLRDFVNEHFFEFTDKIFTPKEDKFIQQQLTSELPHPSRDPGRCLENTQL